MSVRDYQVAFERMQEIKDTGATKLDLTFLGLKNFPEQVLELTQLTSLSIGHNELSYLPEEISALTQLTSLNIKGNLLTRLPEGIRSLTRLTSLDVSNNLLTNLPEGISSLTELTSLDVRMNRLTSLPERIKELTQLTSLYIGCNNFICLQEEISVFLRLTKLDISGNQLISLPEWISALTQLTFLDVSSNKLTCLPEWIGSLTQLIELDVSKNKLTDLPDEINTLQHLTILNCNHNQFLLFPRFVRDLLSIIDIDLSSRNLSKLPDWIRFCHHLQSLDVSGNIFVRNFPKWIKNLSQLTTLDVSNNRLSNLPEEITELPDDCRIHAHNCPLVDPPIEIVKQGIPAIREYFKQKKAGKEKLYEAKLMIVGEPGAGKTTLAWKLLDPTCALPEKKGSTRGIDVHNWRYTFNNIDYRVNMWDFGGQEILKATHQFFMSRRALYVLLADSRKDDMDYFDWLHHIQLFASDSPVIIVHNEMDDRPKEINLSQLSERFPGTQQPLRCNLKSLRGYMELVRDIQHQVSKLELIGKELPTSWVEVRRKIESLGNYISEQDFYELCDDYFDRPGASILSQYLHDIGVILHFQQDLVLRNTVIINPEWGTQAVYQVIETPEVMKNHGRFTITDLSDIWPQACYQGKFAELLQLMMRFELCYEIPNEKGKYILPQLLPYQPPEYKWDGMENIVVQYRYDYLLKSIIIRFIVALHDIIENHQEYVWRNGVVLNDGNARAEVTADEDRKQITIKVSGVFKQNLLGVIMRQFELIHGEFPKMKVEKMVPCNCPTCLNPNTKMPHLFKYSNLMLRLKRNKKTVECDLPPFHEVDIAEMLSDSIGHRGMGEREDYLQRTKSLPIPVTQTKAPEVFISYAWEEEDNPNGIDFIEAFETRCDKEGISHGRDVHDVKYKDNVSDYMKMMGEGKVVLVVLSKKYLHSKFCMHELAEIAKNGDFYDRIFPVVLEDAEINEPLTQAKVLNFWEEKLKELDQEHRKGLTADTAGVRKWLDRYSKIRHTASRLLDIIGEIANTMEWQYERDNMDDLFNGIKKQLNKS